MDNLPTLEEAKKRLLDAEYKYQEACNEENHARSARTNALNDLNNAQKTFDKIVDKLKETAGRESDWHREKHEKRFPA